MNKFYLSLYWSARLIAILILVQTLFFKFSGAPESIYIFTTVGMEPWGRIGIGVMELVAALLMLFSITAWVGAAMAFGLMAGAIVMHLTRLGIAVQGDGGYLFFLAIMVAVCSAFVLIRDKTKAESALRKLAGRLRPSTN
ncbi:MAG TPA: DoxX family protein [Chryseolinea sp.]